MNTFFDFLSSVGFDKNQTRIEKYRIDGTSNYLVSLNYSGITWAVALRLPAMGKEIALFEKDKLRAVDTANYLVNLFSKGIPVTRGISFCFSGNSALVSYESVQDFFDFQNELSVLTEIDGLTSAARIKTVRAQIYPDGIDEIKNIDEEKKNKVKKYLLEYRGPFFASKGAPASETFDDYFDMVLEGAKVLALLHSKTGLDSLLPIERVMHLSFKFNKELDELVNKIDFIEGTSIYESFIKHQKKRNPQGDKILSALIKKELLLRTKNGKELLKRIIRQDEKQLIGKSQHVCFTHNDPHCENFVIVKQLYRIIQNKHQYMDREFINGILSSLDFSQSAQHYSIEYDQKTNSLFYRKCIDADWDKENVNIITPDLQYEVHLIDIDEATGVEPQSRKSYLYDLLIFAFSVQNLSEIKGEKIKYNEVIEKYYEYWRSIK